MPQKRHMLKPRTPNKKSHFRVLWSSMVVVRASLSLFDPTRFDTLSTEQVTLIIPFSGRTSLLHLKMAANSTMEFSKNKLLSILALLTVSSKISMPRLLQSRVVVGVGSCVLFQLEKYKRVFSNEPPSFPYRLWIPRLKLWRLSLLPIKTRCSVIYRSSVSTSGNMYAFLIYFQYIVNNSLFRLFTSSTRTLSPT